MSKEKSVDVKRMDSKQKCTDGKVMLEGNLKIGNKVKLDGNPFKVVGMVDDNKDTYWTLRPLDKTGHVDYGTGCVLINQSVPIQKVNVMDRILKVNEQIDEMKRQNCNLLKSIIARLPDNPKIDRLGDKAFTMSAKDLGTDNWTPQYHDYREQYYWIIGWLESNWDDGLKKLMLLIEHNEPECLRRTSDRPVRIKHGKKTYVFNPEVIRNLREALHTTQ